MSQAKVDKRKYEKTHRKEIEHKRKVKFAVKCIVAAVVIGVIVGVPIGLSIYKSIPVFVGDSTVDTFANDYIDEKYSSKISVLSEDATTEQDAAAAFEEALKAETGSEVGVVNVENVDDSMSDSSEAASEETTTEETTEE